MNTDDSDRRALTEVVATLERAQRHEQVEEFVALFHPDAVWVTGGGRRLIGRDAIAEFTGQVLPGATAHPTARYDVEHIVFVRPDVAVVAVGQRPIDVDGVALADRSEGRPTYVMAKGATGAWRIHAGQNTLVAED